MKAKLTKVNAVKKPAAPKSPRAAKPGMAKPRVGQRIAPKASTKPSDRPYRQAALSGKKQLGITGVPKVPMIPKLVPKGFGAPAAPGTVRPKLGLK